MSDARIYFYGGANQRGGNQFLLEDRSVRGFLDFGMNFDLFGKYYSFPASPQKFRSLQELTKIGIYPDFDKYPGFDGAYRSDYLQYMGRVPIEEKTVDFVLLTHAHLDHASGIHFLDPSIPVYMDRYTKMLLHSIQETGNASFSEFIDFKDAFEQTPRLREAGYTWLQGKIARTSRNIKPLKPPEPVNIGHIKVEPHYVDHSLPGACGLIIHTSAGIVVYTGDMRFRGRRRQDTEAFLARAAELHPDYMLCEGSLINKLNPGTEDDIVRNVSDFIRDRKGLVVASYPPRDLDRLLTFYWIARKTGRKLVIDARQAYILDMFSGVFGYPTTNSDVIRIYMPKKNKGTLDTEYPDPERDYQKWERPYIEHRNRITKEELQRNQGHYIRSMSGGQIRELSDMDMLDDSVYTRSHPEPYTEEMELDEKILKIWLEKLNLIHLEDPKDLFNSGQIFEVPQSHINGHMTGEETAYAINRVNPKVLIPIHTVEADDFRKMFSGEIWIPQLGDVLEL
ncbi:MAG: MBL fold metallo-hydrolase [Candidatus Aenigmatarchaeota archaeon]